MTIYWTLHKLVQSGHISRIRQGLYSFQKNGRLLIPISEAAKEQPRTETGTFEPVVGQSVLPPAKEQHEASNPRAGEVMVVEQNVPPPSHEHKARKEKASRGNSGGFFLIASKSGTMAG